MGYELLRRPLQLHPLWPHLETLFSQRGVNCVLDVGAHHGEYALSLRRQGYTGRIISFEPLPESYQILEEASRHDPHWTCYPFALGAEDTTREFHVTRDTVFCSLLEPNEYSRSWSQTGSEIERSEPLPVRRLDGVFEEIVTHDHEDVRVFLKIDTQGSDPAVLTGAQGVLSQIEGIQSELSVKPLYRGMKNYRESLADFEAKGFEVTGLFPCAQEEDLRVVELDCVMIRTSA